VLLQNLFIVQELFYCYRLQLFIVVDDIFDYHAKPPICHSKASSSLINTIETVAIHCQVQF